APTTFEVDRPRASRILDAALAEGRERLLEHEALEVLGAYGIPTVEHRVVGGRDEAVRAAEAIGYPVVLKLLSGDVVHKTDVGAVRVDVRDGAEVVRAYGEIEAAARNVGASVAGILVETYLTGGRETIVGMAGDPVFGPLLMFGLGGIYVEALRDVAFRVQPVSEVDAREMIDSIRGRGLLEGVRGEPGVDRECLAEVIQRVSQLVGDHPRIAELDINPFLAFPESGLAVDARIRITPGESPSASAGSLVEHLAHAEEPAV
ncbi:MAG TPA: acetate--CoA ligase family protein, partial [Longimicrobiales bacterium]|nr:acetate--CoA ligase family protein [Longimicrobiales bacterium]